MHTYIHTHEYTKEKMNDRSWGGWIRTHMKIENKKTKQENSGQNVLS